MKKYNAKSKQWDEIEKQIKEGLEVIPATMKIYLQKQRYIIIGKSGHKITFDVSPETIEFKNENEETDFVFRNSNNTKSLERWREVLGLMQTATDFIGKLDKRKVIEIPYTDSRREAQAEAPRVRKSRKADA